MPCHFHGGCAAIMTFQWVLCFGNFDAFVYLFISGDGGGCWFIIVGYFCWFEFLEKLLSALFQLLLNEVTKQREN